MSKEALQKDPYNTWLARGPRHRLSAETLRDNALAISGLLDRNRPVGGPSVKPYQPGDLWREMAYGDSADKSYVQDKGPDLYRRGLYVYWKRSIHYPSFAVFDAPNREVCVARRPITNTPLQAFVLLNDVTFVEAARVFAERVMKEGGTDFVSRMKYAYQTALAREPETKEKVILAAVWGQLLEKYQGNQEAAQKLVSAGEYRPARDLPLAEHAAWTGLCQVILNLDETVTKE